MKESEELESLGDVVVNCAVVFFGCVKDFQKAKRIIEDQTSLKIRYQRISLKKLFIREDDRES